MSVALTADGIATPPGVGGWFASLLAEQPVPAAVARLGASLAAAWGKPLRVGSNVLVARHAQVMEALSRDLEFCIAPVNAARMQAVDVPFVLGMDRSVALIHERQALYEALAGVDLAALQHTAAADAQARIAGCGGTIDIVAGYARPVAAATAHRLFGVAGSDETTFMDAARAIFGHVFLNLSDDKTIAARAVRASLLLRAWLLAEIARRRAAGAGAFGSDMMGQLLAGGRLDDDGIRRTLSGMLVGAIDTTATAVAKIVSMIGRDTDLAARIGADVDRPERLAGWCREALRRWPHNPVVMRQAVIDTALAGTAVRAGDQMVLWTQAAMLDTARFPSPGTARPDRPESAYLHFGGGLHPCAGRAINAFQIPLLVGALVRRGIRSVGRVAWAGPFPDHLNVRLER